MSELLIERASLFKDATRQTKPKRIPNLSNFYSWKMIDSDYKFSEILFNYDLMEKVNYQFHEKYEFDTYADMSLRNPVKLTRILGDTRYVINDEAQTINATDITLMNADEYPEMSANFIKFVWEKALPRKYSALHQPDNLEKFKEAIKEYLKLHEYVARLRKTFKEKYEIPTMVPTGDVLVSNSMVPSSALNILFCFLRGMRGLSMDLHRNVKDIDAWYENNVETKYKPALKAILDQENGSYPASAFDYWGAFLSENFLTVKQFEKYTWDTLSQSFNAIAKKDKLAYIFVEGAMNRFVDYIQDAPKGCLALHLENDNIFEMKKRLPNITFVGGMPCNLLYNGSQQECIDYAKKLIDEVGFDGSYIFSQDKMVSFKNDCKAENLKAVNDFVRDYGILK